jgi:hypothetical protein
MSTNTSGISSAAQPTPSTPNQSSLTQPQTNTSPYFGHYYPPHLLFNGLTPQGNVQSSQVQGMLNGPPVPLSTQGVQQNDGILYQTIIEKLTGIENHQKSIDNRLSKLDSIESQINSISQKLSLVDSRVISLENKCASTDKKLLDIERSRTFDSQLVDELQTKNECLQRELKAEISKTASLSNEVHCLKESEAEMMNDIVDLQCRSMRDNLLFFNFDEDPTPIERKNENCIEKVLNFCSSSLGIDDAQSSIRIDRAHRIGKYTRDKQRPIVAKMNFYGDKVKIKDLAREKLTDSPIRISDQFPKVIQERRKKLIPYFVQAKKDKKNAVLSLDKLYIDNIVYSVDKLPPGPTPPTPPPRTRSAPGNRPEGAIGPMPIDNPDMEAV